VALTIAGSDSGGGAGIQADLRVFARMEVFGTSALTAVTAQNLEGVRAVVGLGAEAVTRQVRAVLEGFPVAAVKTGMLWDAETIAAVARLAAEPGFPPLVVDPVMVATSGDRLLREDAVAAYRELLLPRAALVTPNLPEAEVLLGRALDATQLEGEAAELSRGCRCPVLLKGGHLEGDPLDLLRVAGQSWRWMHPRISGVTPHGTGCMLSAAITGALALGAELPDACAAGIELVASALAHPIVLSSGQRLPGIELA